MRWGASVVCSVVAAQLASTFSASADVDAVIGICALAGAGLPLVRDLLTPAGIPLALAAGTWPLVRRRTRLGAVHRAGSPA